MRAKKYLIAANEIKLLLTDWDGADGMVMGQSYCQRVLI